MSIFRAVYQVKGYIWSLSSVWPIRIIEDDVVLLNEFALGCVYLDPPRWFLWFLDQIKVSLKAHLLPSSKYLKTPVVPCCVLEEVDLLYGSALLFSAWLWFMPLLNGLPLGFDEKLMVMLFDKTISFSFGILRCNNTTHSSKMHHSFGLYKDTTKQARGSASCHSTGTTSYTLNTFSCVCFFSLLNNVLIGDIQLLPWTMISTEL